VALTGAGQTLNSSLYTSGTQSATFELTQDYIGIEYEGSPCYANCLEAGGGASDSFTRTVSNGWGTSTSGGTWLPYHLGYFPDSCFSVDGSTGIISGFGISPSGNAGGLSIPISGTDVTVTFKFKYDGTYSSFQGGIMDAADAFDASALCGWDSRVSSGKIKVFADAGWASGDEDYGSGTEPTATIGAWYNARCHFTSTASYVRFWKTTDSEPSDWTGWDIWTVPTTATGRYFFLQGIGGQKIWIDDLVVTSADPDCTQLVAHVIDDWDDRTIGLGHSQLAWADTSGTSDPWYNSTDGDADFSVESGVGRIRVVNPTSSYNSGYLTLNEGGSNWFPLTGAGFPDELLTSSTSLFSFDFMVDSWGTNTSILFSLADNPTTGTGGLNMTLTGGSSVADKVYLDTYDAIQTSVDFVFTNATWYTVKVNVQGSSVTAKVWERGTTEPTWMISRNTDPLPWTVGAFDLQVQTYTTGGGYTNFYFDNFIRWEAVSGVVDPAEEEGAEQSTGVISQTVTYSGSAAITLAHPYVAGTVLVTMNGLAQFNFTQTSPATGVITLGFTPSVGQTLIVTYLIAS
jgi:hypothetical protein